MFRVIERRIDPCCITSGTHDCCVVHSLAQHITLTVLNERIHILNACRHVKFFFCSCKCHIQNTHLLRIGFGSDSICHDISEEGFPFHTRFYIDLIARQIIILMNQHILPHIHLVELFAKTCHKNYRKLQSLALMHGHDPYNILILANHICLSKVQIICAKLTHIADEVEHTLTVLLKVISFTYKHIYVRLSAFSHRSGTCEPVISGLIQNISYNVTYGHIILILLQIIQHIQKCSELLYSGNILPIMAFHIISDFVVQSRIVILCIFLILNSVLTRNTRKFLLVKPCKRGPENRRKVDVNIAVVNN